MKYFSKKGRKSSNKKLLLISLLAIVLTGASVFAYRSLYNKRLPTETNPPGTEKIDLSPPSEADKAAVDQHKAELANEQPGSNTTPAGQKKQVTPIITSASKSEVRAYVPGVVEEGGTCTATATQGSQTVTKTSAGFDNVSYTQCAPLSLNLGSGTWSVVVSYSSASAEGKSQSVEVK